MTFHGYEITEDWKNSNCGKVAIGTKGGKKYFLKKYQTPVAPIDNGTLDAKTFEHNKQLFEEFVKIRKTVNTRIRAIAGSGGNIIIPCDEFIDGNQFVEVSEFVDGVVKEEDMADVLATLSIETKKLLMKTAASALASVHSRGVIHSDLKLPNVLLVKNAMGNYVAKLIDFDISYTVEEKPDEIGGTIDFFSPELGKYIALEDYSDEMKSTITEKTDIFSLGLIYHFYLTGEYPEPVSLPEKLQKRKESNKVIYPHIALINGGELKISPKIEDVNLVALISDMLSLEPGDRPTASEVLKSLQAATLSAGELVLEEPFPEHSIVLVKSAIETAGIAKVEKSISGSAHNYKIMFKGGKKQLLTKEEMLSNGYAKVVVAEGFAEPWPEHCIELNKDKLRAIGFVAGENVILGGVKGYNLYRADGRTHFMRVEMMLSINAATKITVTEPIAATVAVDGGFDEPWPEHRIEFDTDAIAAKGYVSVAKKSMAGVNGYEFVSSSGARRFIRVEMILIQNMARVV